MRAVGLFRYLPAQDPESLQDVELPRPSPAGRDLLVAVRAVSVNPVDTKIRAPKDRIEETARVLGWDAAGEVLETGPDVTDYKPGDQVFYAGDITRAGSNSEFQLVDERIVGRKPSTLDYAQAAALPLTSITAWEGLFERLGISPEGRDTGKSILVIGGAGGVGSIALQLASQLAKLHVIATASRPETRRWCLAQGAHSVIDHSEALSEQLHCLGLEYVDYIFCLNNTDQHWPSMAKAIAPQGRICSIVENAAPVELGLLKNKSATFVWEFMFTRTMFQTPDMGEQQKLLNEISRLIDAGLVKTTLNTVISPINAANLRTAHAALEEGGAIGKTVLSGWQ